MVDSSQIGVFLSGPRATNVMIIQKYLKRERRSLLDELPEGTQIKIADRWPIRIYEVDIEWTIFALGVQFAPPISSKMLSREL